MPPSEMHSNAPTDIDVLLGALIRRRRQEAGLTSTHLAEAIGIDVALLRSYEAGDVRVASGHLAEIAEACALPLAGFFPADRDVTPLDLATLRIEAHGLIDQLSNAAALQAAILFLRYGKTA